MTYEDIQYSTDNGIAIIRLNRPEQLNAYTPDMGDELVDAYRQAASDNAVHALIVTGNGRAFCAGADRECLKGTPGRNGKKLGEEEFVGRFSLELAAHPKLTIAVFNGSAAGIGITGCLPLDIRVASPGARLVLNFAELGIIPGMGASYFLPRLLGLSKARELLICQREVNPQQALDLGLVDYVADDALAKAMELAESARACKPGTISAIKQSLLSGAASDLSAAVETEWRLADELRKMRESK